MTGLRATVALLRCTRCLTTQVRVLATAPPITPVLCVPCAFWAGGGRGQLLVPGEAIDPYVYWEDTTAADPPLTACMTSITHYRGGEPSRLSARVFCLGLPPDGDPLQPNAFLKRG